MGKYNFSSDIRNYITLYYSLMLFSAYSFKGQVHEFAITSESFKSLVLQDKCNIENFLSPAKMFVDGVMNVF